MSDIRYLLILLFLIIYGSFIGSASWLNTTANKDTWVDQSNPTSSYGSYNVMSLGDAGGGAEFRVLVNFDVSPISSYALIDSSIIGMYATACSVCVGNVNIYRTTSSWTEGATWNTKPTYSILIGTTSFPAYGSWYYSSDIKNAVQGIVNGTITNYGFYYIENALTGRVTLWSREGDNPPTIYINYHYLISTLTTPTNTSLINIELPAITSPTNFTWVATSPQYRFVLGQDSISNEVVNTTVGVNYSVQSLAVGHVYYWRVQNVDDNSTWTPVFEYTVNSIPVQGRFNITAFDEKAWGSRILTFNATVYNNTYSASKATNTGWANFSGTEIGQGEYFITVTPNSSYAPRSQLANSPGNVTFYLPPTTSTINTIQFYLLDYSGLYPWDSSVFKIYRNNTLMQSSYFDADAKVGAYLINGDSYSLQVTNGANIYQWGNFMPMASGSINLVILDTGFNKTKYNPFDYNVTWTNSSIIASWLDHGTLISPGINFTVYKGVAKTQVHILVTTQPSGVSEYIVTNTTDIYYIYFTATTTNGNVQKSFVIDYRAGQIKGGGMNDSVNATGYNWDYGTFVMPVWIYNAVAWILLLLLAGSSGYIHSGFMSIVTGVFAVLFWFVGWLDLGGVGPGLLGGIVLIIIISYFKEKEHTT